MAHRVKMESLLIHYNTHSSLMVRHNATIATLWCRKIAILFLQ